MVVSLAELGLRFMLPKDSFIRGYEWKAWNQYSEIVKKAFIADSQLGYHPRLGTDDYDPYGTLILGAKAQKIQKDQSRRRVVFLGDSVTARRSIENALKKQYGESAYEYWNCGVEGYNTYQEVKYYRRFCQAIAPDHVIVTFHNNDFQSTPVAFYDEDGRMAVFSPDRPSTGLNPWLYQHSYIYRLWFSWQVSRRSPHDDEAGAKSILDSFKELQDLLRPDGIRLTVFVLPPCRPDAWEETEKKRHNRVLDILQELKIEHFDLAPGLSEALKQNVDVQETKGDTLHPSPRAAEYFVRHIIRAGFAL